MIGTAIGFLQLSQERVEVERGRLLTRWKGDIRFDLLGDDGLHRIDDVARQGLRPLIDALLFEAPRYQGRAVDFAHAFLLVRQARDYALMARPRKGFCRQRNTSPSSTMRTHQPPSPCAHAGAWWHAIDLRGIRTCPHKQRLVAATRSMSALAYFADSSRTSREVWKVRHMQCSKT